MVTGVAALMIGCAHAPAAPTPPPKVMAPVAAAPVRLEPPRGAAIAGPHGIVAEAALSKGLLERFAAPITPLCRELDLPRAYRAANRRDAEESNLGRGLAIFLPQGTVVARPAGSTEIAVYLSRKLDPSSEVGDAGYRVAVRDANGDTKDASLGFAMLRPYVVIANDALPILDGDLLQLSVDVREVDDASITYPPIGLSAKRRAPDKMVQCSLAAIFRDTDGDGMTDIEEAQLGTDPSDADTDGDGLSDGADPAPLGAIAPSTPEDALRLAALREIVEREAPGELLVLVGPEARFAVEGVSFRLLQLRSDEVKAFEKRRGGRPRFSLKVTMEGTDRAKVHVDFGWRGGVYTATRDPRSNRWTFKETSGWIS